jgi:hypothetical protein
MKQSALREAPTMRWPLGCCLLAMVGIAGCSVDVDKLRASVGDRRDAAGSAAPDLRPDISPDAISPTDGPGWSPDESTTASDGAVPADAGPADQTQDPGDAKDNPDTGKAEAPPDGDAAPPPDLPTDSSDLASDLPVPALDAPDPDDGAAPEVRPEASDADAAGDGEQPSDAEDSGGLGNGASCTSAEQCQSGFCLGLPGRCCVQSCASACYRANQCSTTGACVAASGAITCGDLDALCGLTVRDYANASEWSLQTDLQVGDQATGSDPHALSAVPSELGGSPWIRPSRNSKSATANPLVTFTLSAPADVYVGIDTRVSSPSWLSSWTDSGLSISYLVRSAYEPNTTVTQRLRMARFPAGDVSLGPLGCYSTSSCSMYLTIIRFVDQPSGTPPTCR